MVLEPICEHRFAEHSYGFRRGRGCHDALRRVDGQLAGGHTHVVDIDIEGYFDTIDQERLMRLLGRDVSDGALLTVIGRFLKAGVLEDGIWEQSEEGAPQGGVISPLLSNISPRRADACRRAAAGFEMPTHGEPRRPASSAGEAEAALEAVRNWMEEAGLRLHSIYRKRHRKRGRGRGSDHVRWPNRHFAELGLFSLETARAKLSVSPTEQS